MNKTSGGGDNIGKYILNSPHYKLQKKEECEELEVWMKMEEKLIKDQGLNDTRELKSIAWHERMRI